MLSLQMNALIGLGLGIHTVRRDCRRLSNGAPAAELVPSTHAGALRKVAHSGRVSVVTRETRLARGLRHSRPTGP
jgi:hypothetical protein